MDTERFRIARQIFMEAVELPPAEQERFVATSCGDDEELRGEILALLEADRQPETPGEFVDLSDVIERDEAPKDAGEPIAGAPSPCEIPGYRIVRALGAGGMGRVYEAEQENPRRRVALKVIRQDVATPALRRRFELEAEVLGQLQHPGIASVHEAGTSRTGEPFFAMELVDGQTLTDHVRSAGPDLRARLELFVSICAAVEHAHRRGVIHRDLKPGNILVDDSGQPRILDFGVARLAETEFLTATRHTREGQVIGTLPYMSPEQATGEPAAVDTRTDVYSLGAILHELLAGRPPLDVEQMPLYEALRSIREDRPERLGARDRRFRGDLETIVAKALAKEKKQRYQSASALGADVRRFLSDEPIAARAESRLYLAVKFGRRNRGLVTGAAAAVLAMVVGTVVSIDQARIARQQSDLAERRTQLAVFEANRARRAAAAASIEANDPLAAQEQLDQIPEVHRGWEWSYWKSRIDRSAALIAPGEPIESAVFDATGRRVIVVTRGGHITWWDPLTAEKIRSGTLDVDAVHGAAFSGDRERLAAICGAGRRRLALFETGSGKRLATIEGLSARCDSVAVSRDGQWVVGASTSKAAWVWDTRKDRSVAIDANDLESATTPRCIVFAPDGETVLLSARDGWSGTFGLEDGKLRSSRDDNIFTVSAAEFSRDGRLIALGERSNKIYITDVALKLPFHRFLGHTNVIRAVRFRPGGSQLASAGDWTVRLWDLGAARRHQVLTGHEARVTDVAYSPDGSLLVSASDDGTVRVWDPGFAGELETLRTPGGHVRSLAVTTDGGYLVSALWQRSIQIWRVDSGDLVTSRPATVSLDPDDRIRTIDVSPGNAEFLLTAHTRGFLCLWRTADGELLARVSIPGASGVSVAAAFHPDGSRAVSIAGDGSLRLFEVPSLNPLAVHHDGESETRAVAFSPDRRLVAGSFGNTVRLLEVDRLEPLLRLEGHGATVASVAFDAEGRRLASGDMNGAIILWDVATGNRLHRIDAHRRTVADVEFSGDGLRIASASYDATVRLWDTESGEELDRFRGHAGRVYALAYCRDGKTLFSSATDGTIHRWSTEPTRTAWLARNHRRRLVDEVAPLVSRLRDEHGEASAVLAHLRQDAELDEERRRVAIEAVYAGPTAPAPR